jgi:phosphoribosylformylglycinamidine synthase
VACTGARPKAITNNLNFGNPRRPEVYYQLREAVAGMAEACDALETPVTGGNVSLYNENPGGAVFPTPVIGMVGVVESLAHVTRAPFREEGDAIILLGSPTAHIGGSEYLSRIHGVVAGSPPPCNVDDERELIGALLEAIERGVIRSAHDCSDGGLAVAIVECCIMERADQRGVVVDLGHWPALPDRAVLYGEAQARAVVSTASPDVVLAIAADRGIPARVIGTVGSSASSVHISTKSTRIVAPLARLDAAYHETIPRIMAQSALAAQ